MKFFSTAQLGPKQSISPEGFLICQDVPIGKVGELYYIPGEIPDMEVEPEPGSNHIVAHRSAEDFFTEKTISSLEGKPLLNEHPQEGFVTPENWRELAVGTLLNVRRSKLEPDFMLGDFVIYDLPTIDDVREGKREVSIGYSAEYDELDEPGHVRQYDIIGNHVALVEVGRCGQRCAIGDHDSIRMKEKKMKTGKKKSLRQRFLDALKTRDNEALNQLAEEMPDEQMDGGMGEGEGAPGGEHHTHIHLHNGGNGEMKPLEQGGNQDAGEGEGAGAGAGAAGEPAGVEARLAAVEAAVKEIAANVAKLMAGEKAEANANGAAAGEEGTGDSGEDLKAIEGELKEEAPEGTSDSAVKEFKDSAFLADSFQETVAFAEIISPGIQIPTFDHKADKVKTVRGICDLRRRSLVAANDTPEMHLLIEESRGRMTTTDQLKKMTCDSIRPLFRNVAIAKKRQNTLAASGNHTADSHMAGVTKPVTSPADLNRRNAEYWNKH